MSISVGPQNLAEVIEHYRFAYLMTVTDKGTPHAVQVTPTLHDGKLIADGVGRRSRANVAARPLVSLVWPPELETDYSLIVDGQATLMGESLQITLTRAVLHRPRPSPTPGDSKSCGSDCIELALALQSE